MPKNPVTSSPWILFIVVALVAAGAGYGLGMHKAWRMSSDPAISTQLVAQPARYTNQKFGYSLEVPVGGTVDECESQTCLQIAPFGIQATNTSAMGLTTTNVAQKILANDWYCNAGGPGMNLSCTNDSFEPITTAAGLKGYKVQRTKTLTVSSPKQAQATDTVTKDYIYIFLMDYPEQPVLLFQAEDFSVENQARLDALVQSLQAN